MPIRFSFVFLVMFANYAFSAPPENQTLDLSQEQKPTSSSPKTKQLLDESLEQQMMKSPTQDKTQGRLWSLAPRLQAGLGGMSAEPTPQTPVYALLGLQFRNRPTARYNLQTLFIPQDSMILSISKQWTPSRRAQRPYYGVGFATRLSTDSNMSNMARLRNYYIEAHAGYEFLRQSGDGYYLEARVYAGQYSMGQIGLGYSFALD